MLISPNELQAKACELMLDGREPETQRDWELCVNFWAANIQCGLEFEACKVMRMLFDCPLNDGQLAQIAEYQIQAKRCIQ